MGTKPMSKPMTAADCWADLEAKALDVMAARTAYDSQPIGATVAIWHNFMAASEAFERAANPATILKLIEAARHSQPGAEGGWQPIETHDGSCAPVLLWFPDFSTCEVQVGSWRPWSEPYGGVLDGDWLDRDTGEPFETVASPVYPTHWRPLPASPQQPATSTDEKVGG